MKAAAYARFSTDKQTENSIDTQLAAIGSYCYQNGHSLVSTYIDMAMSGTNMERPDFQRMITAAKARLFDCVIVYDISRASRDVGDWMGFRKLMTTLDIEVLSTTEQLGRVDDPNAFLTELLTAGLGQHMVLQTRQKSMAGVAQKATQGVFLGGIPPLGYDVVDGQYVINQREAETVRLVFSFYAEGKSYKHIIDKAAALNYVGKRGQPLGKNSLHDILKNERYIGIYTWNKLKRKYMGRWCGGKPNPDIVRIEGIIPAIISQDIWERVQKRMSNNKHNASNTAKNEYLLSGLIECSECGGAFIGKTNTNCQGRTYRYYTCNNKYRTRTCKAANIPADEIEEAVTGQLMQYLATTDFEAVADETMKAYNKAKTARPAEEKELNKLRTELQNCLKAIRDGLAFPELQEEISRIRLRISELENLLAVSKNSVITKEMIIAKLKKDVADISPDTMPRLVKSYVTKIYAADDEIIITGGVSTDGAGGRTRTDTGYPT